MKEEWVKIKIIKFSPVETLLIIIAWLCLSIVVVRLTIILYPKYHLWRMKRRIKGRIEKAYKREN